MSKKIGRTAAFLAILVVASNSALADSPSLQLSPAKVLKAGHIRDGAIVLTGRLTDREKHAGFRIQCEALANTEQLQVCTLHGQRDDSHILRVRLDGRGWQPESPNNDSKVAYATDESMTFRLVADGDQAVAADSWTITIGATAFK